MVEIPDDSIELAITSPPYPMIQMWDMMFEQQTPYVDEWKLKNDPTGAFGSMHNVLWKVWTELYRVITPGGFVCINMGDATRTVDGEFALYPNHSRTIERLIEIGFTYLPSIIWRKQTNAPNKFMGSGMLPSGAYVTLEHEYILIFRKGGKRKFKTKEDKQRRMESAFFWEERNSWFSDVWDIKGTRQKMFDAELRAKSAAFPIEIPYRLINMYSLKGDTVLDPFWGLGTTTLAAIASERNSIGYEIDVDMVKYATSTIQALPGNFFNNIVHNRVNNHHKFIMARESDTKKSPIKYYNEILDIKVMTKMERFIDFNFTKSLELKSNYEFVVEYMGI